MATRRRGYQRVMRIPAVLLILLLLATFAPPSLYQAPAVPAQATLSFQRVPLEEGAPGRRRIGELLYLGGWVIRSDDPRFGGISALHVEGSGALAVSDAGALIRFSLPGAGPLRVSIEMVREGPGSVRRKVDRDIEAMAVHGGRVWLGYEQHNAVWRYSRADWHSDAHAVPPAMADWPSNDGSEAMVRLADGTFLVFSEAGSGPEGSSEVLLFEGDPAEEGTPAVRLGYRPPPGYRITDAALLPDGRILFLNRRFTLMDGVSAVLTVGDLGELSAGHILEGREVARLQPPVTVDNMEALSVTQEGDRTIVWMASDDNLNPLQRTLLLKFTLDAEKPARR